MKVQRNQKILRILRQNLYQSLSLFQYSRRAVALVWDTSRNLTIILASLTLVAGLLPAASAYAGKLIIDGVVLATQSGMMSDLWRTLGYLGLEAIVVELLAISKQGLSVCQSLLRALLGQKVSVMILEKALSLELIQFEDSELYDKMSQARRGASTRPLSLVRRTFELIQDLLSLMTYSFLLLQFSLWTVVVLLVASIPAFVAETRFAGEAFRLFCWRTPESREQGYLESLIVRESSLKEVKLYQLGSLLLERHRSIFERIYHEDRNLTLSREFWSYLMDMLGSIAFYAIYVWIVVEAIAGRISLGDMTMYVMVFSRGKSTFSGFLSSIGDMYEDNLYLSNLYDFLEQNTATSSGQAVKGLIPGDGLRFESVWFTYPGTSQPALKNVSLHLKPGEKLAIVGENGSGKTTLINLLTRLYVPDKGRVLLDGLDLQEWDREILSQRIGVIFQNFVQYQFTVGENIGVGDANHLNDEPRWRKSAEKGMALSFIEKIPENFHAQLGRLFKRGRELSLGQWQKIALSRAFMRENADILVLDEPTASMDAEAEFHIFKHFHQVTENRMAILISHRFSTVRIANRIAVLEAGELVEQGTHTQLLEIGGRYARLFSLQAEGYN
ncbi:MAG: Vitamin B12 import ATP-binding protein BtuD [Chroococcidiopsis cubana SAG 39.79]|uniref:ABC transporter permease n=1 Tax=Chroococcidiopsis cubana SAG 39.79 TaxID=388085 RepID=A0AB37UD75_9CYAN|nr:ABC transporter ATP-binding protein [Chroococcidiopsis cubana]MDZ4871564.1 Vitamin B12 import ATP-binding protein BtuD [Chroococcidiopsis cubana SAG 39.79]PSB62399.1 ABC transporter permease [Chroococcidiopsis cubana CCALA 043]RUT05839.1 ABC transporter permease [Chroococcidiopsis cubana SAG 39.79]